MTGASAYSGGITVNAGNLQGNASGLKGNINVTNSSAVVFDQTSNDTYAGNFTGNGGLTKTGAGDLSLTGTNTYSGVTTVDGGALLFASAASLGTSGSAINLNNGTIGSLGIDTLTIARGLIITNSGGIRADQFQGRFRQLTWSGVIGGTGQLVKSGNQDVILTGAEHLCGRHEGHGRRAAGHERFQSRRCRHGDHAEWRLDREQRQHAGDNDFHAQHRPRG